MRRGSQFPSLTLLEVLVFTAAWRLLVPIRLLLNRLTGPEVDHIIALIDVIPPYFTATTSLQICTDHLGIIMTDNHDNCA